MTVLHVAYWLDSGGGADRIAERVFGRVGREGPAAGMCLGQEGQLLDLGGDRPDQPPIRLPTVCRIPIPFISFYGFGYKVMSRGVRHTSKDR